ncbi:DUF1479 domain protein [Colletotrichum tofieldiae]|nr:DUF1479 domain protein [Colletotrichum tofieldiae]
MPGRLINWPAWQEYENEPDEIAFKEDFARAKAAVIAEYGQEALTKSWLKVCKELETVTNQLANQGSAAVPVYEYSEIGTKGFNEEQKEQIKARGCCIVRNTIPEDKARSLFQGLKNFVTENRGSINGWPVESPAMLRLFNSPTQIKIRTDPRHIALQRQLNALFHDASDETSPEPLSYTDATRIRPPGQTFLGLGPHIDAGSLCRWAHPQYRKVYDRIFSGEPENHDAYDLDVRKDADQYMFPAGAHSAVFRAFQGWTALTPASPSCGTLMLYPNVKTVIAYVVLRPFFSPPKDESDMMDASKWAFDGKSPWFPGTTVLDSQRLSTSSHPHLRLKDCLVHIPSMGPGDTVWWHTDMCHAVDPEHNGEGDASVVYIAACPTTKTNKDYVKKQLQAALVGGGPPDRVGLKLDESALKGYKGFDDVSEEGKMVLGFNLL